MRRATRALAVLVAPLTTWLALTPAVPAHGQAALRVQAGAPLASMRQAGNAPVDGMRFYAPPLKVHDGDTVTFTFAGFHTATLLPANTDPDAWVQDNIGPSGQYSLLVPDPDDGGTAEQPEMKGNDLVVFPSVGGSRATCGTRADPCDAGSAVVNSGLPFQRKYRFTATINGAVGDRITVICLVHLAMRLDIEIVDASTAATTQSDIDTYRNNTTARDARRGKRLDRELSGIHESHRQNGHKVWDAYAGYDARGFSLLGMYPARLQVRKGQRVQWHFDELIYEDHTVSMPLRRALRLVKRLFMPLCDTDGDGSGDRSPPDRPPPEFCSTGEVEFVAPAKVVWPRGDGAFDGSGYENSGIRGPNVGTVADYTVRFTRRTPDRGLRYVCELHPFMRGTVVVG